MDHFDKSIDALQGTLRDHEAKVTETKKLINSLAEAAGREPIYHDVDTQAQASIESIRPDTFYGQPLNTSIRRVLEMRQAAGLGPATVRDICDLMKRGGFEFPRAKTEKNEMDSLRISLGKSSHTFHKLPNGQYGLLEWYPNVKPPKKRGKSGAENADVQNEETTDNEGDSND